MRIDCDFSFSSSDTSKSIRPPYVDEVFTWSIHPEKTEGTLEFNARFNPSDEEFPLRFGLFLGEREDEPLYGEGYLRYHYKFAYMMEIEIYRREEIADTSVVSEMANEDGQKMYVCFTPMYRQKIWFRIFDYKDITSGVKLEQSTEIVKANRK